MMGDRDYRSTVQNAIDSISRELETDIDTGNTKKIHLKEIVRCMRRSYYDRTDPIGMDTRGFSELLAGLLRKMQYGCEPKGFDVDDIVLEGRADMIADDIVILFRPMPVQEGGSGGSGAEDAMESPHAADALYLNACMWIYGRENGIIVYVSGGRREVMFTMARNKKMFEEAIRRTRVLANLLQEGKTPILEPSAECSECQYYERCYTTRRHSKQLSLSEMFGLGKGSGGSGGGSGNK